MSNIDDPQPEFLDRKVVDEQGQVIGTINDVVFDPATSEARWAVVKPGKLHRAHYMPLRGAYHTENGDVVVPHSKETVTNAPVPTSDHVLSEADERALRDYYGPASPDHPVGGEPR